MYTWKRKRSPGSVKKLKKSLMLKGMKGIVTSEETWNFGLSNRVQTDRLRGLSQLD